MQKALPIGERFYLIAKLTNLVELFHQNPHFSITAPLSKTEKAKAFIVI